MRNPDCEVTPAILRAVVQADPLLAYWAAKLWESMPEGFETPRPVPFFATARPRHQLQAEHWHRQCIELTRAALFSLSWGLMSLHLAMLRQSHRCLLGCCEHPQAAGLPAFADVEPDRERMAELRAYAQRGEPPRTV